VIQVHLFGHRADGKAGQQGRTRDFHERFHWLPPADDGRAGVEAGAGSVACGKVTWAGSPPLSTPPPADEPDAGAPPPFWNCARKRAFCALCRRIFLRNAASSARVCASLPSASDSWARSWAREYFLALMAAWADWKRCLAKPRSTGA